VGVRNLGKLFKRRGGELEGEGTYSTPLSKIPKDARAAFKLARAILAASMRKSKKGSGMSPLDGEGGKSGKEKKGPRGEKLARRE